MEEKSKEENPVHCLFEDHQDVFIFSLQTSGSFNQKIKRFFFENGFGSSSTFAIHATPIVMSNRFIPEFLLLYIAICSGLLLFRNLVWKSSKIVVFLVCFFKETLPLSPIAMSYFCNQNIALAKYAFFVHIIRFLFFFIFFQSTSTYLERTSKFSAF